MARITPPTSCPICLDKPSDPTGFPCKHAHCSACIAHYISSAIASKDISFPLSCQYRTPEGEACHEGIPLQILRKHTSQSENDQLFETAFLSYVNSHPDQFRYCPTANCPQIYRLPSPSGIQCPSCSIRICTECNGRFHGGLTCDEVKNDEAFKEWMTREVNVKPCPKCKSVIEKIDGCNNMRCRLCSTSFCWTCLEIFSDVYTHLEAVHGGVY
jgi:hypothetical protein